MQERSVIERVEILERKVEALETLPERVTAVELQLVQLRNEMRTEFSAIRGEIRAGDEETRRSLGDEIRAGDEETRRQLREGDEETRQYMRLLHEEVISRLRPSTRGAQRARKSRINGITSVLLVITLIEWLGRRIDRQSRNRAA